MSESTLLYDAIMGEVESRRIAVGLPMGKICELAGIAERSYAKMLYPNTSSGRRASWAMLQIIFDTLYCEGFRVRIEPTKDGVRTAERIRDRIKAESARWDVRTQSEHMSDLARLATIARKVKISPAKRKRLASIAARARWRKVRAQLSAAPAGATV